MSRVTDDNSNDELGRRLRELSAEFEDFRQFVAEDSINPRVRELELRVDRLETDNADLRDQLEAKDERIDGLAETINISMGVEEPSQSTPQTRKRDLRLAMIKQAEYRDDTISGNIKWWWREAESHLIDYGHGGFSKPVYYQAMKDAAEARGFSMTTKENPDGVSVDAIRLNPDELPPEMASNQLTTGEDAPHGAERAPTNNHVTTQEADD